MLEPHSRDVPNESVISNWKLLSDTQDAASNSPNETVAEPISAV